jgi:hypothetical protein
MLYNNFGVSFSTIRFMMEVLDSRKEFVTYERTNDILFHIHFEEPTKYTFVLVADYITSAAKVREFHLAFPEAKYIVMGGTWWNATSEAYSEANDLGVKIMSFKEFLAALHNRRMP